MNEKVCRVGIIGTGRIAHRFVPEARTIDGLEVTAVYNPRRVSAEIFAKELNIADATDDVIEFVEKVDAVYIATPHETHGNYCRQMLLAGKHVLCEKPMSFSGKDAQELFALAEEKSLVLMEGIKTAYCTGFQELIKVAKSGKIGQIVDVEACFSRIQISNVREMWDIENGGSFTEFGTYSLLPIVKLLGTKYSAHAIWSKQMQTGVDAYTKMSFDYGDATATAKTGLSAKSEGQLVIAGTKGYILAPSPWWLTKYFEVRFEDPNKKEVYEFSYDGAGLRYEIQSFWDKIKGETIEGISDKESIWLAEQMEKFLFSQKQRREEIKETKMPVKIWAHRGCSMEYPENTLSAFEAAAKLEGITGIELDIQLTKDNKIVVIHDETVDRTTNGSGNVKDFTLEEIKQLEIQGKDGVIERIPTMKEVFSLLKAYCDTKGLLINIELKNSNIRYDGMEKSILELVRVYGLENHIVYSSFLPESMKLLKELDASVHTGILGSNAEWCKDKAIEMQADAIHPWNGGLNVHFDNYSNSAGELYPVRVWNVEEPLFGQDKVLKEKNMTKYVKLGATDIITNVPELYL